MAPLFGREVYEDPITLTAIIWAKTLEPLGRLKGVSVSTVIGIEQVKVALIALFAPLQFVVSYEYVEPSFCRIRTW